MEIQVAAGEKIQVLVVVGTRPEAIKMVPVISALEQSDDFETIVLATGQHSTMVAEIITEAGLRLDADLQVSHPGESLNQMFARVMVGVDQVARERAIPDDYRVSENHEALVPALCLVHGDTSSAAAAAVAAFNLQIPVVHVEAGLRTNNILSPFPEEGNRQIISRLSALHLAPTPEAKVNLIREGVDIDRILVTGNTSIDMLRSALCTGTGFGPDLAHLHPSGERPLVLVTAHRRENWGRGLENIAGAIAILAERYPNHDFVIPLHPNPKAQDAFREALGVRPNCHLVPARRYPDFARLMQAALLVISDSGGVQEEAPSLGTPVLVTRETTERWEGVHAGTLELIGTERDRIVAAAAELLDHPAEIARRGQIPNPYGDGYAAERMVQALANVFGRGEPVREYQADRLGAAVRKHANMQIRLVS